MVKQPYSKTEHVARHDGLKQKDYIQPKNRWKALPLSLLLPYSLPSCLSSPPLSPLTQTRTHCHHPPFLVLPCGSVEQMQAAQQK